MYVITIYKPTILIGWEEKRVFILIGRGWKWVKWKVNTRVALMFEAALDVLADALMYLQTKYNMRATRNDKSVANVLKGIRKIAAVTF